MTTPSSNNVLLGKGEILFDRVTSTGVLNGYRHLGNCSILSIAPEPDILELRSYMNKAAGIYKRINRSNKVTIKITGYEFDADNLALGLFASTAALTQSASTVVAEVLAPATYTSVKGKYFQTAFRAISSVVVKQGATTFVDGTDYVVTDATQGIIHVLSTGAIADGTALTVDYSYAAVTSGTKIHGASQSSVEGKLLFRPDPMTGPKLECVVWSVSFASEGELGLISDDWGTWQLSGTVQDDSAGQFGGSVTSPYFDLIQR